MGRQEQPDNPQPGFSPQGREHVRVTRNPIGGRFGHSRSLFDISIDIVIWKSSVISCVSDHGPRGGSSVTPTQQFLFLINRMSYSHFRSWWPGKGGALSRASPRAERASEPKVAGGSLGYKCANVRCAQKRT